VTNKHLGLALLLLLAACSSAPTKQLPSATTLSMPVANAPEPVAVLQQENPSQDNVDSVEVHNAKVCRQIIQHDERNYTAGGLYAPHISDASPDGNLDISKLQEPTPRAEPKSRYGNRSPYKVLGKKYFVMDSAQNYKERGIASWYGTKFHGRATSSSEIYDMCQFSAAHKTLPIPSYVRVTRLDTGQSVIVRVNDRGPFHAGRIIDLSFAAATKLGINKMGTAKVEVETISDFDAISEPSQVLQAASNKNYLQIASFSNEDNAKALLERLQRASIDEVFIQKHFLGDDFVWRVRLGPFNEAKIQKTQDKLAEMGLKGVRVGAD
jgi:rare lipoprotein A